MSDLATAQLAADTSFRDAIAHPPAEQQYRAGREITEASAQASP
jgi:hypothetical protein